MKIKPIPGSPIPNSLLVEFWERKLKQECVNQSIFRGPPTTFILAKGVRKTKKLLAICTALDKLYDSLEGRREINRLFAEITNTANKFHSPFPYKGRRK